MRVVVTREAGRNDTLRDWLPEDAQVSEVPLTTTRPFDPEEVRAALHDDEHFGTFQVLVLTSSRSAPYRDVARGALAEGALVVSVGAATTSEADVVGSGGAMDVASAIVDGPVLLLGASSMRDELPSALRAKGLSVTTLACYETLAVTLTDADQRTLRSADVVVIGAPSAWAVGGPFVSEAAWVVVPGATTAAAVRQTHERIIEGWGPALRERLVGLEGRAGGG